jgi:hypothetical protein
MTKESMKQYKFTGFTHDKMEIDSTIINAYNYYEALKHARFLIRYPQVKHYKLKLIKSI